MNIYTKIYLGLLIVTALIYCLSFHRKKMYGQVVILLMAEWLITTVIAITLVRYYGYKNNLFVFHISTPIEYAILCVLYSHAIVNRYMKRFILFSIPVFILICILFAVFVQHPDKNNAYAIMIESIIMVLLSLFFLRETLLFQHVKSLHSFPMFWICAALLFYFIGNFVIEGMLNYLVDLDMALAKWFYRLGYIFKYLLFVLFIVGALCSRQVSKIER